jgi:hypothetical protein
MGRSGEQNGEVCPRHAAEGQERLRESLRSDPYNRELRLAYRARRPPRLSEADFRLISRQLAQARAVKVALGFTFFGLLGGWVSWAVVAWTGQAIHGQVGLAIILGTGSALFGAIGFLALAALGPVPLEDLFVPYQDPAKCDRKAASQSPLVRFLVWTGGLLIDLLGGALWGTVCGLGVGVLGGVACAVAGATVTGLADLAAVGALGGVLLGALLAGIVVLQRAANPLLPVWVDLGPIPWPWYLRSVDAAWRRFLGK